MNLLIFETFNSIDTSIAKKLLTLAQEKEFIKLYNGKITFLLDNLWKPAVYKLDWQPNFDDIEEVKEYELDPLPSVPELKYVPRKIKKIKPPIESDPIETPVKKIREKKPKAKKKKKSKKPRKEVAKKKKKLKKSKKVSKKKPKKVVKKKGKSLEDFF